MSDSYRKAIEILGYRFSAIEIGLLALEKRAFWAENTSKMCICVNGKLDTEAATTAFTNSAVETGVIHSRVLLEFLGLKTKNGQLVRANRNRRHADDFFIEDETFGSLKAVTPEGAVHFYSGSSDEGQRALVYVIHLANKGMAHSTINFHPDDEDVRLLDIAFRAVRKLMENHFYSPLCLRVPESPISEERSQEL